MLKRSLYFSNPFHLSTRLKQLVISSKETGLETTVPIEDIGFIILDHKEINISTTLVHHLTENNVAVVFCNETHHPHSLTLPLDGHHIQAARFKQQLDAGEPLKKQLWAQTIKAKIKNQQRLFAFLGKETQPFSYYISQIKSGDTSNEEAQASRHYWKYLFDITHFRRDRFGDCPNNFLNFGYTVLRSAVARALTGSGLLPTLGIHHRNKYNAYQLADDIMEPFRPWVDKAAVNILKNFNGETELTKEIKAELISVIAHDSETERGTSPLMVAIDDASASLAKCFAAEEKQIKYPLLI
jgi:CRISPR-associated protein Cas1